MKYIVCSESHQNPTAKEVHRTGVKTHERDVEPITVEV